MSSRVLMVDDDRSMANALSRALSLQFDITIANSGEEALELMRQENPFEVVVTDLRMPQMDGVELIQAVKELAPNAVFILLTGTNDSGTQEYIASAGGVYCTLYKPCTTKDIRTAINGAFEQYKSNAEIIGNVG